MNWYNVIWYKQEDDGGVSLRAGRIKADSAEEAQKKFEKGEHDIGTVHRWYEKGEEECPVLSAPEELV